VVWLYAGGVSLILPLERFPKIESEAKEDFRGKGAEVEGELICRVCGRGSGGTAPIC